MQSSSGADEKDVAHSKSEDADGAMTVVDTSMWVASEAGSSSRFACVLLRHLDEAGRISDWISCNRGCFSLAAICKVPSACKATQTALGPYKSELVAAAASHAGGKLLLECMSMP